jgi:hypothetical protein
MGVMINAYKIVVGKSERLRRLGILRRGRNGNIKIDFDRILLV